jgi:hypothetical protein
MAKLTKEKFIQATANWYNFVGKDHYKDRDCHWEIGQLKRYSYGNDSEETYWFVRHQGYVAEFEEVGDTEKEVMEKAILFIQGRIDRLPE